MPRSQYSRAEHLVDAIVHIVGVAYGLTANATLAIFTLLRAELIHAASLGVYAVGLLAMSCARRSTTSPARAGGRAFSAV